LSGRAKGGDDDGGGRKEVHVPYAAAEKGDRERERESSKKRKKNLADPVCSHFSL